jgi:hypothetical protein
MLVAKDGYKDEGVVKGQSPAPQRVSHNLFTLPRFADLARQKTQSSGDINSDRDP